MIDHLGIPQDVSSDASMYVFSFCRERMLIVLIQQPQQSHAILAPGHSDTIWLRLWEFSVTQFLGIRVGAMPTCLACIKVLP